MFNKNSFAIVYGLQLKAAQRILDFDYLCEREPSVIGFINPGQKAGTHKLFYGNKEVLVKSYGDFASIPKDISKIVDTLINLASHRSAYDVTISAMNSNMFQNIIVIAEWIPERQTREIVALNKKHKMNIIGPSTVWALYAGGFRAWNTWGSLENIILSKLYKPGSVWCISKSGGMSNELRRMIWDRTDGTNLSIALGWDKYNIMNFKEAMEMLEAMDEVKMIVMLWEVGGVDEIEVADMIKSWDIKKPVVAWCIGTIDDQISGEVQFGHAGAKSNNDQEAANYKNAYLKKSGSVVPKSFMDFWDEIEKAFKKLNIKITESDMTKIDEKVAQIKQRKASKFTSTISDERGEELHYNKKAISEYTSKWSFANVIGNLWLKRDLPAYAEEFINTVLILLADHGPAVSGATNAIVTARAGNDLKSSLIAGLTTIGPRFGGAIDGAGKYFSAAVESGVEPRQFVTDMKKKWKYIPGIGHKVKSKFNPDKRCEIMLELAESFPNRKHLDFALEVEQITLEKKSNLILNVDGMIAAMLLDIMSDIGMSYEEIQEYIEAGIFNGLFILARTTGFIWHIIDQKRLGEWLYRTPWEDIMYE